MSGALTSMLTLLPLVLVLAGCACILPGEDCDPPRPKVTNQTAGPISVLSTAPGRGANVLTVEPGDTRTLAIGVVDGCHRGQLIATDEDGRELSAWEGPFCAPEEWVILDAD